MANKLANFDSYLQWHWADLDAMQKILKKDNVWARLTRGSGPVSGQHWSGRPAASLSLGLLLLPV